jgi:hypothetical protein
MTIQMLLIVEMRDRYALAECLQANTEHVGPLLGKTQGLCAAYLAGEEGESTLAIVTLFWTNREAAVAWLYSGGDNVLQGTLRPYSLGEVIVKFFHVEHEHEIVRRHLIN